MKPVGLVACNWISVSMPMDERPSDGQLLHQPFNTFNIWLIQNNWETSNVVVVDNFLKERTPLNRQRSNETVASFILLLPHSFSLSLYTQAQRTPIAHPLSLSWAAWVFWCLKSRSRTANLTLKGSARSDTQYGQPTHWRHQTNYMPHFLFPFLLPLVPFLAFIINFFHPIHSTVGPHP